jgi:biopolymer transport protein ExbB
MSLRTIRKWPLAVILLSMFAFAGAAMAQEEAGMIPGKKKKSALELFAETGWVGILLAGVSVAGVALTIENFVSLRRDVLAPPDTINELEALIDEGQYDDAIAMCDENDGFITTLIGSALRMRHAGYEEMIGVLEQAAAEESFKLQAKISYLSLLGNVAPLLGLLGTVTGMITSFQKIESMKAPTPGDLASGVYESLVNTTMGLFIAIVFLTVYFIIKNKVTKMTLSMALQAVEMLKSFAAANVAAGKGH